MIRALTWGSSTLLRATLSRVVVCSAHDPISSVWRFGRDFMHSTNKNRMGECEGRCTFMNLQGTRISPDTETKMRIELLYVDS